MSTIHDLTTKIARKADTTNRGIDVAVVSRVLRCLGDEIAKMKTGELVGVLEDLIRCADGRISEGTD